MITSNSFPDNSIRIPSFDRLLDIQFPPSAIREFSHFANYLFIDQETLIAHYLQLRGYFIRYLMDCAPEAHQILLNHLFKLNRIFVWQLSRCPADTAEFQQTADLEQQVVFFEYDRYRDKKSLLSDSEAIFGEILQTTSIAPTEQGTELMELLERINHKIEYSITEMDNRFLATVGRDDIADRDIILLRPDHNYRFVPDIQPTFILSEIAHTIGQYYLQLNPTADPKVVEKAILASFNASRARLNLTKGNNGHYTKKSILSILSNIMEMDPGQTKQHQYKFSAMSKLFPEENQAFKFWDNVTDQLISDLELETEG